tara:strand:+ start:2946 stop:3152 length:207 start_codon:yes stop_codon:yes gene_type:complete
MGWELRGYNIHMEQLNENELKNILFFLNNGKWNLNTQEANELLYITKKVVALTTPKVETQEEIENVTN